MRFAKWRLRSSMKVLEDQISLIGPLKASISFIKTNSFCYTACPLMIGDRQCNKKVTRSRNSRWQRNRCNQEFDECDYRYLLQVQIQGPHKIDLGSPVIRFQMVCLVVHLIKKDCFLEYFHVSNDRIVLSEQQNKREVVFLCCVASRQEK